MSVIENLKRTRVVERAVDAGEHGEVGVRAERDGQIVVKWLCGGMRTFDREQLQGVIDDLELLAQFPDVWFEGRDHCGYGFIARIVDDYFYADEGRPRTEAGGSCVPWKPLRKALLKAAKVDEPE